MIDSDCYRYHVGIIAIACNIDKEIIHRFQKYAKSNNLKCWVKIVTENSGLFYDTKTKIFNKSKALNYAIKELLGECQVIIQTDIDMLIPPGLIEETYRIAKLNQHVFCKVRNSNYDNKDWEFYKTLPIREAGYGAWNALTDDNWERVGGYNEDLFGWGGEDDDLHNRIKQHKITTYTLRDFPLIHINHDNRTARRVNENNKVSKNKKYNGYNWLTERYNNTIKPNVICLADKAMGLGDGCMLLSALIDLSKEYNVRCLCSNQSHTIAKTINNDDDIKVMNMNDQGKFYTNDYKKSLNLIYWDVWNSLRQMPHQAINMIRKCAGLPIITKEMNYILPEIPIPARIDAQMHRFINSLPKPVIITQP